MIRLKKHNITIFTPHKCGSSTLNYVFTQAPNSEGTLIHGPQLGLPHIEKHTNILPYDVQNGEKLTKQVGIIAIAVRNPYTRALSIYNHHLRFDKPEREIESFADFVKYRLVVGGHYFSQTLFSFCRNISQPIPQKARHKPFWPNYIIHLETIKEDIEGLGLIVNVPIKNPTPTDDEVEYATMDDYTPETIDLVKGWGEMDFNSFGYYHEFDKCHLVKERTDATYVVPPDNFMENYGGNNFINFMAIGKSSFDEIRDKVYDICDTDIVEQDKVLDFGCRAGRIIRYFDPEKEIWGVDVRKDIIDWCNDQLPYKFWANKQEKFKLPFENNYFDFIYSLSVFSHIEHVKEWMEEVVRTLKVGGLFYLSINDEEATDRMLKYDLKYIQNLKQKLDFEGFLEGKYPVLWDGYFSFIQRDHFLKQLPPSIEVVAVSRSELFQTGYILKKNDNTNHKLQ